MSYVRDVAEFSFPTNGTLVPLPSLPPPLALIMISLNICFQSLSSIWVGWRRIYLNLKVKDRFFSAVSLLVHNMGLSKFLCGAG